MLAYTREIATYRAKLRNEFCCCSLGFSYIGAIVPTSRNEIMTQKRLTGGWTPPITIYGIIITNKRKTFFNS